MPLLITDPELRVLKINRRIGPNVVARFDFLFDYDNKYNPNQYDLSKI